MDMVFSLVRIVHLIDPTLHLYDPTSGFSGRYRYAIDVIFDRTLTSTRNIFIQEDINHAYSAIFEDIDV